MTADAARAPVKVVVAWSSRKFLFRLKGMGHAEARIGTAALSQGFYAWLFYRIKLLAEGLDSIIPWMLPTVDSDIHYPWKAWK